MTRSRNPRTSHRCSAHVEPHQARYAGQARELALGVTAYVKMRDGYSALCGTCERPLYYCRFGRLHHEAR